MRHFLALLMAVAFTALSAAAQSGSLIRQLEGISATPHEIIIKNSWKINNNGGHLQGIQMIRHNEKDYYLVTGSSDSYSYYAIMKSGEPGVVLSLNKILEKPFKHAGGFQIHENLMAIGVEDNNRKKRSKVFIFKLDNPEKPPREPLAIIERYGTAKRGTAGCTGITVVGDEVLIVVGDWDTRHLDFYVTNREKLLGGDAVIELEYTIDTEKIDKSGWTDKRWPAYQNINLLQDDARQLYLAGFGTGPGGNDILDLFTLQADSLKSFSIKKIYTKDFGKHPPATFRYGAGLWQSHDKIIIFSCPGHIGEKTVLYRFE